MWPMMRHPLPGLVDRKEGRNPGVGYLLFGAVQYFCPINGAGRNASVAYVIVVAPAAAPEVRKNDTCIFACHIYSSLLFMSFWYRSV